MSVPFSFSDCLLAEIHWTDTPALPGLIIALVVTVGFAGLAAILIRLLDSSGGSDPPRGSFPQRASGVDAQIQAQVRGKEAGTESGHGLKISSLYPAPVCA